MQFTPLIGMLLLVFFIASTFKIYYAFGELIVELIYEKTHHLLKNAIALILMIVQMIWCFSLVIKVQNFTTKEDLKISILDDVWSIRITVLVYVLLSIILFKRYRKKKNK